MRFVTVLLFVCSLLFVNAVDFESEIKNIIDRAVEICEVKENVTDEEIGSAKTYSAEQWVNAHEVKCFSECFFEEIGLVRNQIFKHQI